MIRIQCSYVSNPSTQLSQSVRKHRLARGRSLWPARRMVTKVSVWALPVTL